MKEYRLTTDGKLIIRYLNGMIENVAVGKFDESSAKRLLDNYAAAKFGNVPTDYILTIEQD